MKKIMAGLTLGIVAAVAFNSGISYAGHGNVDVVYKSDCLEDDGSWNVTFQVSGKSDYPGYKQILVVPDTRFNVVQKVIDSELEAAWNVTTTTNENSVQLTGAAIIFRDKGTDPPTDHTFYLPNSVVVKAPTRYCIVPNTTTTTIPNTTTSLEPPTTHANTTTTSKAPTLTPPPKTPTTDGCRLLVANRYPNQVLPGCTGSTIVLHPPYTLPHTGGRVGPLTFLGLVLLGTGIVLVFIIRFTQRYQKG